MKPSIEERLRERLAEDARRFSMDPTLHPLVVGGARRRLAGATAGILVAAVAVGAISVVLVRSHPTTTSPTPRLRLVNYVNDSQDPGGAGLQQYVQCMRDQGFDVGDAVRTRNGWAISAPANDFGSPAWQ